MDKTYMGIMREINGALLDVLSLQEKIEAGMIRNSAEADKVLRLTANLHRRADLIEKKVLNDLEIKRSRQ